MEIAECQTRDEYLKKLDELQASGRRILSIDLYWYEGAGRRRVVASAGPVAKAMFSPLSLDQKIKVAMALHFPDQFPADIQALAQKYRECLKKDFETEGGYTAVTGDPEKAVYVIEYE